MCSGCEIDQNVANHFCNCLQDVDNVWKMFLLFFSACFFFQMVFFQKCSSFSGRWGFPKTKVRVLNISSVHSMWQTAFTHSSHPSVLWTSFQSAAAKGRFMHASASSDLSWRWLAVPRVQNVVEMSKWCRNVGMFLSLLFLPWFLKPVNWIDPNFLLHEITIKLHWF